MERFMHHDFAISEIVLCGAVKKGMPIHRNRKSHGLVFYPDDGCAFCFADGKDIRTEANSVIYLPKGSDYNVVTRKESICYAINFQLAREILCDPFCIKVKNSSFFLQTFKAADKAFGTAGAGHRMKCKSYLCDIISALQYEYSMGYVSGEKRSRISAAVSHIHGNYTAGEIKVSHLAKMCGMSPEYFRSIFGSVYGVSPLKYITDLRIVRAKELLSSGMYSVTETAHMCGYEDVSYFSRLFSKAVGVPPSVYTVKNDI